jgi:hypothetical protein
LKNRNVVAAFAARTASRVGSVAFRGLVGAKRLALTPEMREAAQA